MITNPDNNRRLQKVFQRTGTLRLLLVHAIRGLRMNLVQGALGTGSENTPRRWT